MNKMDKNKLLLLKKKIKETCISTSNSTGNDNFNDNSNHYNSNNDNVLNFVDSTKVNNQLRIPSKVKENIPIRSSITSISESTSKITSSSSSSTTTTTTTTTTTETLSSQSRQCISWSCLECKTECIPVRMESRCLCGHRLKEHNNCSDFSCKNSKCKCSHFFFIVAEGAWILRCRCKHKHIEHDCSGYPYKCINNDCKNCDGFDSPWVCNCGHGWNMHKQSVITRSLFETGPQLQDVQHKNISFAVRQDGLLAKELKY